MRAARRRLADLCLELAHRLDPGLPLARRAGDHRVHAYLDGQWLDQQQLEAEPNLTEPDETWLPTARYRLEHGRCPVCGEAGWHRPRQADEECATYCYDHGINALRLDGSIGQR